MDRNQLEQQALQHLNRGDTDAALKSYLALLKLDPKDLRIRQKAGDLFARTGRANDAERMWRELYEQLVASGSHRQAVAILKQLVSLRPEDAKYNYDLGECYVNSGYPNDARQHYERAMKLDVDAGRPVDAAKAARRLAELSPGDLPAKLKVAELLEKGNDKHGSARIYQEVMDEFRRRGRADEVGRVAELALRSTPDDPGLLLDAAAARLEAGDHKRALVHLQAAFPAVGKEPRTLDLLARAFEGQGAADKAQRVLSELVRAARERAELPVEADALRRLLRVAPNDEAAATRLAEVEEELTRRERRLSGLVVSQAASEEELRAQVRAEVYCRFGFFDRAEEVVKAALEHRPDAPSLVCSMSETLAAAGKKEEAIRWMERLLPVAGAETTAIIDRIAVLKGNALPVRATGGDPPSGPRPAEGARAATPAPPPPVEAGASGESAEARGDRLAAAGDDAGALMAWRDALGQDPMNEGILGKIGALRSRGRSPVSIAPEPVFEAPLSDGTFAEFDPDALQAHEPEALDDARSWVAVGQGDEALALLADLTGLEARVIEAQALRLLGEAARAMDVLRDATNDAPESDEAYAEALFELAGLYIEAGKHRAALRLVEELAELHPAFRARETTARRRGLQRLLG